jgi:hypothetical protein
MNLLETKNENTREKSRSNDLVISNPTYAAILSNLAGLAIRSAGAKRGGNTQESARGSDRNIIIMAASISEPHHYLRKGATRSGTREESA